MNTSKPTPPTHIPALEPAQRLAEVPERLAVALDARDAEKALQAQLVAQSLEALRPQLERLARETLAQQAKTHWREQATRFDPPDPA